MGSNEETPAERPVHKVTISRSFWMADREISLFGAHENVAEWTRSAFRPYPIAANDGRDDPANADDLKVVRGGFWHRRPQMATSSWHWRYPKWMRPFDVGFRVVIED